MFLRTLLAAILLFILWLLLSGHYNPLLLTFGVLSSIFVAWIAYRMSLIDSSSNTLKFNLRLPTFIPWFFIEIIKSNLDVCRRILHPSLPIDPKFVSVDASQLGDLGKAVFANCVTLTPGTYSVDTDSNSIEVHAISNELAEEVQRGELSNRIAKLEKLHKMENS